MFRKGQSLMMNNGSVKTPMLVELDSTPRPRLVSKDGKCLLGEVDLPRRYHNVIKNWFHLLIELRWRLVITIFACSFVLSWTLFGLLYYSIVLLYGDRKLQEENKQCIANVHSFISAFLFSMETQHTIGYGYRYMTTACPPATVVVCTQCVAGVLLQTLLAGIIVAKLLRPKKRREEMRFSRIAVIGPVDDQDKRPALMVRLADVQQSLFLAESHVRLYMVRFRTNAKGCKEIAAIKDVNVGYDSGWDRVLLLWPIIVRHVIDESSPLFGLSRETLRSSNFELIMTVEGIVEATGMTFQARTSFLPDEILWGYRFIPMVTLDESTSRYEINYNLFEQVEKCENFVFEFEESEDDVATSHNASGFV
ncbi:hypothetical protein AB6A40_001527 [Gnathostoma spinigerum]|uniref:Uncharacterized protein n=1 Tax=Gnathostoma spinigerum TaxID=75299 RepID=A0ABD6EDA5_9BILA